MHLTNPEPVSYLYVPYQLTELKQLITKSIVPLTGSSRFPPGTNNHGETNLESALGFENGEIQIPTISNCFQHRLQHSSCSGKAGSLRHCFLHFLRLDTVALVLFSSMLLHSLSSGNGGRLRFGRRGRTHSVAKLLISLHLSMSTSGKSDAKDGKASFTSII